MASSPCGIVISSLVLEDEHCPHSCTSSPLPISAQLFCLQVLERPAGSICTSAALDVPASLGTFPLALPWPGVQPLTPQRPAAPGEVQCSLPCLFSRPSFPSPGLGLETSDFAAGRQAALCSPQREGGSAMQEERQRPAWGGPQGVGHRCCKRLLGLLTQSFPERNFWCRQ